MRKQALYTQRNHGMSLIELMVAIAIGSILMTGLVMMFTHSSESRRELEKTGVLIENGRYATQLLYDDIRHAGFYGYYYASASAPSTMPDPCETSDKTKLTEGMALPIEGYTAPSLTSTPDISATSCGSLLTSANLAPGSDILVIRRASTEDPLVHADQQSGEVYLEANVHDANFLLGTEAGTLKKYPGSYASFPSTNPWSTSAASLTTPADIRKYEVHVYFVAPCSNGTGSNGVCQSGDDTIPTLKRLELVKGSSNAKMEIDPLVEGVEYMKVTYGIDSSPSTVNVTTTELGDGMPDSYTATPATIADWMLVDGVRIYLLVRSSDKTPGYVDRKTYTLGPYTIGPFSASADLPYYRHVFDTEVLSMDVAGRREIP